MCQRQAKFPLCVLPTADNLGDNFNSCNHVPLMSARFPFYYYSFLSAIYKLNAKRTRKISRLSSNMQPFDNSSPAVFDFSLMIADFGYGWLFIPSESFPPDQAAENIRNYSALERLSTISVSSCCSSQCQGHVKSQFALRCCSPLARSAIVVVRKASPHTPDGKDSLITRLLISHEITAQKAGVTHTRPLLSPNT